MDTALRKILSSRQGRNGMRQRRRCFNLRSARWRRWKTWDEVEDLGWKTWDEEWPARLEALARECNPQDVSKKFLVQSQ